MQRTTVIRMVRVLVLCGVAYSSALSAQSLITPPNASTLFVQLIFGTTAADFLARVAAIILYGSSVVSAGIHRAYPDPVTTPRWVLFASGAVDAMSVNGKGARRADDRDPTPAEPPRARG